MPMWAGHAGPAIRRLAPRASLNANTSDVRAARTRSCLSASASALAPPRATHPYASSASRRQSTRTAAARFVGHTGARRARLNAGEHMAQVELGGARVEQSLPSLRPGARLERGPHGRERGQQPSFDRSVATTNNPSPPSVLEPDWSASRTGGQQPSFYRPVEVIIKKVSYGHTTHEP